jgi:hypothetical protein
VLPRGIISFLRQTGTPARQYGSLICVKRPTAEFNDRLAAWHNAPPADRGQSGSLSQFADQPEQPANFWCAKHSNNDDHAA